MNDMFMLTPIPWCAGNESRVFHDKTYSAPPKSKQTKQRRVNNKIAARSRRGNRK
jgi:hypothetical protein|nr:MAG TPA: hypothetical protein [Caudoviricetes sp.]